jgi:hypothetical protein
VTAVVVGIVGLVPERAEAEAVDLLQGIGGRPPERHRRGGKVSRPSRLVSRARAPPKRPDVGGPQNLDENCPAETTSYFKVWRSGCLSLP